DGSIDWLCLPRFDSASVFGALVGTKDHGRWLIAPTHAVKATTRRYEADTLILTTDHEAADGAVTVVDFMPMRGEAPDVARIVVGRRGSVQMRSELTIRFDYGSVTPWVRHSPAGLSAVGGPDALRLKTPVRMRGENFESVGEFVVHAGERIPFVLTWYPSYRSEPPSVDAEVALRETRTWWEEWCRGFRAPAEFSGAVLRSLITLKALTDARTGGIVAAPTTSLPEHLGGVRNWDYRFCWLRDATFTLLALMNAGFREEATAWREWLLRAVAGSPSALQIMYGVGGERRLTEQELPNLPGYEGSRPVRIGNAAHRQFQLDVYGEVLHALHQSYCAGLSPEPAAWDLQRTMLEHLEGVWQEPDEGIWEVRGGRKQFTHSKVMAWVALDRGIKSVERMGFDAPLERWKKVRAEIHREVLRNGYSDDVGAFVQFYGSKTLDASLLQIPLLGFLPPTDRRVIGTLDAIQNNLMSGGLVRRYSSDSDADGLPAGEGAFLPCTFWMADNLCLMGRQGEARQVFQRLLDLRNDLGLLSEEYDPEQRRMLGNFPQAFSHVALVNTAFKLVGGPSGGSARARPA
ncbi:MAG: glycoside hydrolase family 15 protein, partial [Polyangiaceae bacterium]